MQECCIYVSRRFFDKIVINVIYECAHKWMNVHNLGVLIWWKVKDSMFKNKRKQKSKNSHGERTCNVQTPKKVVHKPKKQNLFCHIFVIKIWCSSLVVGHGNIYVGQCQLEWDLISAWLRSFHSNGAKKIIGSSRRSCNCVPHCTKGQLISKWPLTSVHCNIHRRCKNKNKNKLIIKWICNDRLESSILSIAIGKNFHTTICACFAYKHIVLWSQPEKSM